MNIFCDKGNQTHIVVSRSGSGTVINYGSGCDFLTSYGSDFGSGSTSQKVTVPMVPVPQRCPNGNSANQNGGGGGVNSATKVGECDGDRFYPRKSIRYE